VLLRAGDPFSGLTEITTISATRSRVRFINVAREAGGRVARPPGAQILWFGTGLYRQATCTAAIPASSIGARKLKYWDGACWAEAAARESGESGNLGGDFGGLGEAHRVRWL
jgi:hypothetical protein